jgi:hypothetical protein
MAAEMVNPTETPDKTPSPNQQLLGKALIADASIWTAQTQAQRQVGLATVRNIFQANAHAGDTTFEISTNGVLIGAASGTDDHPARINNADTDVEALTLKADKQGNFSATFTHEDHETHDRSVYQVTQDSSGNITFKVEGAEALVDGKVVSADGTTTHDRADNNITLSNPHGTIAFHRGDGGAYSADVTFGDGSNNQKPITAEQFQFQQEHGSLFVDWQEGHHYAEGMVPPPFQ